MDGVCGDCMRAVEVEVAVVVSGGGAVCGAVWGGWRILCGAFNLVRAPTVQRNDTFLRIESVNKYMCVCLC